MSIDSNIGSLLTVDDRGYLIPESSLDKIPLQWLKAINCFLDDILIFGSDLIHSVYVRGSVAKGMIIAGKSDIDLVIILNGGVKNHNLFQRGIPFSKVVIESNPVNIDVLYIPIDKFIQSRHKYLLKIQGVCIYGVDILKMIEKVKPGLQILYYSDCLYRIAHNAVLQNKVTNKMFKCVVRAGFELVSERSQSFSRDLYPCWTIFSQFYPQKSHFMYKILQASINTDSANIEKTSEFWDFILWIEKEGKIHLA